MKLFKLIIPLALILVIALANCKHQPYDLPQPIIANTGNTQTGNGNVIDSICYSEQIAPILLSNCAKSGCHNDTTRQSGINLSSYENMKATISGNLLMQVIQDHGIQGMPPAPNDSLSPSQISIIQEWVNEGMPNGVDCMGPCDTTNVTFSGTIYPILQNNCLGCHSSNTGTNLVGYANVYAKVSDGKLYCAVNHTSCALPMPQNGPQLSACKLAQINKWIANGAPNN